MKKNTVLNNLQYFDMKYVFFVICEDYFYAINTRNIDFNFISGTEYLRKLKLKKLNV